MKNLDLDDLKMIPNHCCQACTTPLTVEFFDWGETLVLACRKCPWTRIYPVYEPNMDKIFEARRQAAKESEEE